jgi:hypothetical protein
MAKRGHTNPSNTTGLAGFQERTGHTAIIENSAVFKKYWVRSCTKCGTIHKVFEYFAQHCDIVKTRAQYVREPKERGPTQRQRALNAVQSIPTSIEQVARSTGIVRFRVATILAQCADEKLIQRTDRGLYQRKPEE